MQQNLAKLQQIYQALDGRQPKKALKLADEALIKSPGDNALKSVKCLALIQSQLDHLSTKNLESIKSSVLPVLDSIIHQAPFPVVNDIVINQVSKALKLLGECTPCCWFFVGFLIFCFL